MRELETDVRWTCASFPTAKIGPFLRRRWQDARHRETGSQACFHHLENAANRAQVLANFQAPAGHRRRSGAWHGASETQTSCSTAPSACSTTPTPTRPPELVNEGIPRYVSIEAIAKESERVGDVVRRIKATLVGIALCRSPAFSGAGITAVREAPLPEDDPPPSEPPNPLPGTYLRGRRDVGPPRLSSRLAAVARVCGSRGTPLRKTTRTLPPTRGPASSSSSPTARRTCPAAGSPCLRAERRPQRKRATRLRPSASTTHPRPRGPTPHGSSCACTARRGLEVPLTLRQLAAR